MSGIDVIALQEIYATPADEEVRLAPGQPVIESSDLTAHDRFLSDHYMIKVSVKDYVDDADPR